MKLGNILDKMKGSRNPAWLFLSYDLDNSRITAVRRVAQDAPVWADWNQFVKEQVERCFKDISNIPNERVYAFRFDNLESIPYLQGENNNHYIEFVSRTVPSYQLGILECAFALEKGILPTELRKNPENYDTYTEYVANLQMDQDMELFKRTVRNDSENYELLYDLVARYTDVPEITQEQIGILNDSPCGLRVFSVLEELLKSSEYVQNTLDFDSYESLIYTPVAERNGLHYLKAELDKFDYASGRKGEGDPEKRKKILELTLFIRRFEITRNWEDHNIDREWFSACIARMSDAEMVARELQNFAYIPALTRAQLQYLMRTGTTAETLSRSGIMGDVIMETPFFHESFGLDLSQVQGRKIEPLDQMLIDATCLVIESSLEWLKEVAVHPDETQETRLMAEREIPEVEQYLSSAKQVALELGRTLHAKSEQDILTGFGKVLESAASFYTSHLYDGAGDNPQIDSEIIEIMSSKPADTELSEKMAALLVEYVDRLPVHLLSRCQTVFSSQVYGQLPIHHDMSLGKLLQKTELQSPLQRLGVGIECRKLSQDRDSMEVELKEKKRTERRIQKEINDLSDRIGECSEGINRLKSLMNGQEKEN